MRFYAITVSVGIPQANLASIGGLVDTLGTALTGTGVSVESAISSVVAQPVPTAISAIKGAGTSGSQWCSVVNGVNDPGALDIEFDIQLNSSGIVQSGVITIYGIQQSLVSQASVFTGCQISLSGGFTEGLPLAKMQVPHQGILVNGLIWPCVGNWTGNQLSLTFYLQPGYGNPGGPTAPVNLVHNMPKGTPLGVAAQNAFNTAFPGAGLNLRVSPNLTLPYDDHGYYQSIEQYLNYLKELSHSILGTTAQTGYQGVRADTSQSPFKLFDGTLPDNTVGLQFEDLIGQPTWVESNVIQVKTPLRADIRPNCYIALPQNILTTTNQAGAINFVPGMPWKTWQLGDILNFQGNFWVRDIRHQGRFRNPNGESQWVTIINATSSGTLGYVGASSIIQAGIQTFIPSGGASGGIGMQ